MPTTELLQIGVTTLLLQNVVYALPTNNIIRLTCDDATATFQASNDFTFANFNSSTLTGAGFDSGYAFIRATNKDALVHIRSWLS